jgi:CheY-like chemotaxis protein
MNDRKNITALVADDEKIVRDFLSRFFKLQSINVKTVENGLEAVEAVRREKFTFAFLDIRMPKMSGLEAYREIKKIDPGLRCVFMTGYAVEEGLLEKTKQPEAQCIRKPFKDIKEIKDIVDDILKTVPSAQENGRERRAFARMKEGFEIIYKKEAAAPYVSCVTKDLSACGLRIVCQEEIPEGALLELGIKYPKSNLVFEASGKVIWNKLIKDGNGNYEVGIDFTSIDFSAFAVFLKQAGVINGGASKD